MTVVGQFYIDNDDDAFYLFEQPDPPAGPKDWFYKGRLIVASVVGLWTEPLHPYTNLQQFGLAPTFRPINYSDTLSQKYSSVTCANRPNAECVVAFTDDLAAYLGYGERAVCLATFAAGADTAVLTFSTLTVPGGSPLWAVMPPTADANLAGVRALIGGRPQ
jgi:hypothetical protein